MRGALGFEDENEKPMHQMNCSETPAPESQPLWDPKGHWLLCVEDWRLLTGKTGCVAYSFSMDNGDAEVLKTVLDLGCEVHKFDPNRSTFQGVDKDHTLAGIHNNIDVIRRHRAWPEWRTPRKRKQKKKGRMGSGAKTLADIMEILGHQKIDFLYADLLSAEWRVLQNWAELEILRSVGNLIATVHRQWAGFEVPGTNEKVVRYCCFMGNSSGWISQSVENAHGSYTLSWVNTRY